jgi:YD repeat-containing protein
MSHSTHLFAPVLAACIFAAAAIGMVSAASAKPNNPINAATTDSGTGCLVRDGAGVYHYDATCEWHLVRRRDRDGNLVLFSYHDQGQLPDGAPRPSSADRHVGPWPGCLDGITEVTTPSGQYRSDCRFHN